ncbi:DnaJ-24 [Operophtera brumata]|uniref:DnaJ-24 n=1 Tax=Operophtera brumata TaxID=104452 RepID=A0A0L7KN90_OPEBR|nr:DnaJ-24 [Operophtera brumata]
MITIENKFLIRIQKKGVPTTNIYNIQECYELLNVPEDSKQDAVRQAFLDLVKKYHPDSGSPEADMDMFVAVEGAFRTLSKHNTGKSNQEEISKIVFDIRHTAPQHRQYLSFEGLGHGNPFQRQKQWAQVRAQRAITNVIEHRLAKSMATENTVMEKGLYDSKKHDIKTKRGFDRLVEDLIQESMSKGEFNNLSGHGKPLKNHNTNPYILINNGFTPEWITMSNEIEQDKEFLKRDVARERSYLGPHPLCEKDSLKWDKIREDNKYLAETLNHKITKYNLIVPLINKQKFQVQYELMCEEILKNGTHSVERPVVEEKKKVEVPASNNNDIFVSFLKALLDLLTFERKK